MKESELLEDLLSEAKEVGSAQAHVRWHHEVEQVLQRLFGGGEAEEFAALGPSYSQFSRQKGFLRALAAERASGSMPDTGDLSGSPSVPVLSGDRIFIIHGHDEAAKLKTKEFLRDLGLEPVVLHEQPNKGRAIMEKFEEAAEVAFAIGLLTSDDHFEFATGERVERARQNVIFEIGFFMGKLGRERVCLLYEEGVELPSDYGGLGYTILDPKNGWRNELLRELRAAGINVDSEKAAAALTRA